MKKCKKIFITITALVSTLSLSSICKPLCVSAIDDGYVCSHGYHTLGDYKLSSGISNKYYIIESDMYSASNGTKYGIAVSKSIGDWNDTSTPISVSQTYANQGKTAVFRYHLSNLGNNVLGRTYHYKTLTLPSQLVSPTTDGKLTSNYSWTAIYLNGTLMDNLSYTVPDVAEVAAHEFGHAVGLSHRNTQPHSIMCQTAYGRTASVPATTDAITVNHLYN